MSKATLVMRCIRRIDGSVSKVPVKVFDDPKEAERWSVSSLSTLKRLFSAKILDPAAAPDADVRQLPTVKDVFEQFGIQGASDEFVELPVTQMAIVSILKN